MANKEKKYMTVASLIEILKTMPQDGRVCSENTWGWDYVEADGYEFDEKHHAFWIFLKE